MKKTLALALLMTACLAATTLVGANAATETATAPTVAIYAIQSDCETLVVFENPTAILATGTENDVYDTTMIAATTATAPAKAPAPEVAFNVIWPINQAANNGAGAVFKEAMHSTLKI